MTPSLHNTTILSKLTFIQEGISVSKILQHVSRFTVICNGLFTIYRIFIGDISLFGQMLLFLSRHNKFPGWVHFQRSLSNFSSDNFLFLWKFASVCPLLAKTVCKTLLISRSCWTLDSDHVCRSHHSMWSTVRLYSNHTLLWTNQNASFTLFIV